LGGRNSTIKGKTHCFFSSGYFPFVHLCVLCVKYGLFPVGEDQLAACDDDQRTSERNQPENPGYLLDLTRAFLNLAP